MQPRQLTSRRELLKAGVLGTLGAVFVAACSPSAPASPTAASGGATAPASGSAQPTTAAATQASGKATGVVPAAAASPQTTGPVTVSLMDSGDAKEQEMFKNAIKKSNEVLADKKITIAWQPYPGGGWDKIMSMFAANQAYDIQRIDDDRVTELAFNKKIWQLDQWWKDAGVNQDDFLPLFWTALNLGGYQFAMEPAVGANVLYYNIDLFKDAGVDMPPTSWANAWSWDEFVTIAGKLVKKSGNKTTTYALGFPANVATPIAYGAGGSFLNADQTACTMTNPDVVAAIDKFVQLTKPGGKEWFVPEGLNTADQQTQLFNAGKLAMIWDSMDFVANISKTINWDICPWMKTPKYAMTENYDRAFVISKSAKHPQEAFTGLMTQCIPPVINIYALGAFGVPYHKATAEGPDFLGSKNPPKTKQVWIETLQLVNNHPVDVPTPRNPAMEDSKNTFVDDTTFGAALSGQTTTKDYLDAGCVKSNDAIKKYTWHTGEMEAQLKKRGSLDFPGAKIHPESPNP